METAAVRRLGVLSEHVVQENGDLCVKGATAEERKQFITSRHHGVFLPENLKNEQTWNVVRSAISPEKLIYTFEAPDDKIQTLYDNLENSAKKFAKVKRTLFHHRHIGTVFLQEPYLGTRKKNQDGSYGPYEWVTYEEAARMRTEIGSGLLHLGLRPNSTVGIFSINCRGAAIPHVHSPSGLGFVEWVLLDAACHAYSMVTVPLYDTLGPDIAAFICNHAEIEAVGCSATSVKTMLDSLSKCPTIKAVIVWDLEEDLLPAAPVQSTCQVLSLRQLSALGTQNLKPHIPPQPDSTALICYTSGTTGIPKGAKLTHKGLIANAAGNAVLIHDPVKGHRHLSYLPLAHIYERLNLTLQTHLGTGYGFYHGDILTILDDVMELKPTLFSSVPRLFNRIYDKVMNGIKESDVITRQLFTAAYASKKAALAQGDISQARLGYVFDKLVFSKLKEKLGGKVEYLITGASPISAEVFDFLKICFGAHVLEGYGMTETCCTISLTNLADTTSGHVGSPVPCCEVKLVDIPEMNYLTSDQPHPRGEVCVRGPILFVGYHKDEKQTAEVIDEEGWFHTGDVGCWLPNGRLKIIDRKKNLFKLAQGEYVAPEKIENIYTRCPLVAQVFVYGDSFKHQLVGIVVPDAEVLFPWAKQQGIKKSFPSLCNDKEIISTILDSIQAEGRIAGLAGFEQVQAICLMPEAFSVENDLLTPTFKLKRHQAKERYKTQIDELYRTLDSKPNNLNNSA